MIEKFLSNNSDLSECPVRSVMDRIGDKWSLLILLILNEKHNVRFNELYRMIKDISQKMLSVTLKNLEMDGYVKRTMFAEVPPRVEYELTSLGESLLPHIIDLVNWAEEHLPAIKESRQSHSSDIHPLSH
ncbi:MAG TPA: helix-turn-helix domain-containing protein [Bacteroidales bacterium]|jgi:DNA-binding HxlR family transcriptional regulator|nr:helix-turn-helix domain-containing protein [Bacteroidales bacterium]HQQ01920.1 helix-turn-helix domain-containing protein [Bacteroidales bacterium]